MVAKGLKSKFFAVFCNCFENFSNYGVFFITKCHFHLRYAVQGQYIAVPYLFVIWVLRQVRLGQVRLGQVRLGQMIITEIQISIQRSSSGLLTSARCAVHTMHYAPWNTIGAILQFTNLFVIVVQTHSSSLISVNLLLSKSSRRRLES